MQTVSFSRRTLLHGVSKYFKIYKINYCWTNKKFHFILKCMERSYEQWRTQEFCSGGGGGCTNLVEDGEKGDLGAVDS